MNPVDERFEHRLLDRFHYDDRQDGDGYGPDSPRVGDKGEKALKFASHVQQLS